MVKRISSSTINWRKVGDRFATSGPKVSDKTGQMKIQQMAFMIVAVFIFFVLVGLFVLNVGFGNIKKGAEELQREQAISSLQVISDMPELNCGSSESLCLDKDKLRVMSGEIGKGYEGFWPVASVKAYVIYPTSEVAVKCPATNCNYYEVFDNGQKNSNEYSTYVSICERIREQGGVYNKCEIGKLVVGVILNDE